MKFTYSLGSMAFKQHSGFQYALRILRRPFHIRLHRRITSRIQGVLLLIRIWNFLETFSMQMRNEAGRVRRTLPLNNLYRTLIK